MGAKLKLLNALEQELSKKSLDDISIVQLIQIAGVNRQTFYYHFKDVFDLVEVYYNKKLMAVLGENITYDTWQIGLKKALQYMKMNERLLYHTYHSKGREYLTDFLNRISLHIIQQLITKQALVEKKEEAIEHIESVAFFYERALSGLILEWARQGMHTTPEEIVSYVDHFLEDTIRLTLKKLNGTTPIR
ncbi:TetR/AcrR family transcriptional regulator [Atopobacter phocae]|uniref:TetR/AcrR family transcriptional regulator n=1 Tax=Atopobacter phocae TaxID=136492 RepID=UPI0004712863|nr:TetR-like C-terminal domain-containing protein [Atopobacter phocae]